MSEIFTGHMLTAVLAEALVSIVLVGLGFLAGKYRERRSQRGRDLSTYDFYPFSTTPENFAEFDLKDFRLGIHYLLRSRDPRAARQLIFIGEQNHVREQLDENDRHAYERLYAKYRGREVGADLGDFMENYRNIVRLLGKTFPHLGIEILLHDLTNPARSITAIEGAEVTGRSLHMGTTALLIDLKRRRIQNQDKLNYELNLGARRFKCTTIPIVHRDFGVVGAICMNIDVNFVRDAVLPTAEGVAEFFRNYGRIDMQVAENILSKEEYQLALRGKRHFRDAGPAAVATLGS